MLNGSIAGTVWDDANANATRDAGESGIPNITVYLDDNDNGQLDWSDDNLDGQWQDGEGERWTLTGPDGGYSFTGLVPGDYTVDELTPQAVWDAMWNRRTLAAANGKLAIWAQCDGAGPGQLAHAEPPVRIRTWLSAATRLRRACLMRDGEPLEWQDLDAPTAELDLVDDETTGGSHWYSVTAEADSPFHNEPVLCHASPIFVEL